MQVELCLRARQQIVGIVIFVFISFVTAISKISIPTVSILYVLTNISYLTLLTPFDVINADALAIAYTSKYSSGFALFMAISVALSTFGAANGSCLTGSRLTLAAARKGHMPRPW